MDTTLMPLNTAQFTNSISSIGEWFQPYFDPLLTLGLMFAGITIAVIVVRALYFWAIDMVYNATHTNDAQDEYYDYLSAKENAKFGFNRYGEQKRVKLSGTKSTPNEFL